MSGIVRIAGAAVAVLLAVPSYSADAVDPLRAKLVAAENLVTAHSPGAALVLLDEVIAAEDKAHDSESNVFSSRSLAETLMYLTLGAETKTKTVAYDDTWSLALFMKGFVLIDMGRPDSAEPYYRRAIALAPSNSHYLSEFAEWQKNHKNLAAAYSMYQSADAASALSPDEVKGPEQRRAWRGMAFILSEQGKFDDAEALYRKCLAADPADKGAQAELAWIATQRPK